MKLKFLFFGLLSLLLLNSFPAVAQLTIVNITKPVFKHPESAVYDAARNCIYISNMNKDTPEDSLYTDFVSKMQLDGTVTKLHFIDGLSSPSGLAIYKNHLYIVERNGVAKVNLDELTIDRFPISATGFLNDIAVDTSNGIAYISETSPAGKIYILKNSIAEVWMQDTLLANPNGILVRGNTLIAGVNGDGYVKSIDLNTHSIKNVAYLGLGNIDGIQEANSNLLVSHLLGNLYSINSKNEVKELLNTRDQDIFIADFAYIPGSQRIIIPSLRTHKIYIYKYER